MALTTVTVTAGSGDWGLPDGSLAQGGVTFQPTGELSSAGNTIAVAPVTLPVVDGDFVSGKDTFAYVPGQSFLVTEHIRDAAPPAPYVVTPSGSTLDLSTAARSIPGVVSAPYVLASLVGQPGGLATLGSDGLLDSAERPPAGVSPWLIAEQFAGLSDPDVITLYSGNDPNNAVVLDADTTYSNLHFIASELVISGDRTRLVNCIVECGNADFGVRFDEDGGVTVGRVLEHCQITCTGVAISGAGFTARLCEVVNNGDDSVRLGRGTVPTVLEYCHFHAFKPAAGAHADGVQIVTWPAADVYAVGCSITMDVAAGYTVPPATGFTGALFYDPTDVPIAVDDPQPLRRGMVWFDGCKLSSSDNFSVVVDEVGVRLTNSLLLPGTTGILSNPLDKVITGWGNVDANGDPLTDIDIAGRNPEPYTLASAQDADFSTLPTNGQVPVFDSVSGTWKPGTVSGGGFTPVINKVRFTSGDVLFANTLGSFQAVQQVSAGNPLFEVDVAASVGDWVEIHVTQLRTTGAAALMDIGVMVGASVVRWMSSDTATPAGDGLVSFYSDPVNFTPHGDLAGFTVTSGDLDAGVVRFVLGVNSNGTNTLKCSAGNPVIMIGKNLGPHN